jgi:release factor glutamine methyltransferase
MAELGTTPAVVASRLARAGCVAALEEADELIEAAEGDTEALWQLVGRRETGEPLAWVIGWTRFLGQRIRVDRGVYVPRPQTEILARRAVELLPRDGSAADLCTGSGALAAVLGLHRPQARVVASDLDPAACRCAATNGVEVYQGDLADPLPVELHGRLDLVVAVVPYVPTGALEFLPIDSRDFEPLLALDGGPEGTRVLERLVPEAAEWLRPGGSLLLELGADQDRALSDSLRRAGFGETLRHEDGDGDLRGLEAPLR